MRRTIACAFLIATSGCASTHPALDDAGADAPVDADVLTEGDRAVIGFLTATCEAWAGCPTGIRNAGVFYAHGAAQCMTEWGLPWIETLREDLRAGRLLIDSAEFARCTEVLASRRCPARQLVSLDYYYRPSCDWSVVFRAPPGLPLGAPCGYDDVRCDDGLQCSGTAGCPLRCVESPQLGGECGIPDRCALPWRCGLGGTCEIVPTREVGEGEACGWYVDSERVDRGCPTGLFCQRNPDAAPGTCARIPRAGEPCPDGLCEPGSFCRGDASGAPVCTLGPRREGDECSGDVETDPCDHRLGLVCGDGRCIRAGRSEGESCIASCDEGLYCAWTTQRCTRHSTREFFTLPNDAICDDSHDCQSHWCDRRVEPYVCRPSDTPCD